MQFESLISFGPKYFIKTMIHYKKMCNLRPLYFAQKCTRNAAGNGVSETKTSKIKIQQQKLLGN